MPAAPLASPRLQEGAPAAARQAGAARCHHAAARHCWGGGRVRRATGLHARRCRWDRLMEGCALHRGWLVQAKHG